MQIRMVKTAAGPHGTYLSGSTYEVADDLAAVFFSDRAAVPVRGPVVERAVIAPAPVETTVARKRGRPRKGA